MRGLKDLSTTRSNAADDSALRIGAGAVKRFITAFLSLGSKAWVGANAAIGLGVAGGAVQVLRLTMASLIFGRRFDQRS